MFRVVKSGELTIWNTSCIRPAKCAKSYTKRYAKALRRAGHPCELVYYKDNGKLTHAFPALKPDLPESGKVIDQMLDWSKGLGI